MGRPLFFLSRIKQARVSNLILALAEHYQGIILCEEVRREMPVPYEKAGINPLRLRRAGNEHNPPFIWAYNIPNLWKAIWAKSSAKCPLIYNFMGVDIEFNKQLGYGFRRHAWKRLLFRNAMRFPDYFVCMSPFIKDLALKAQLPEEKLVVIPNFFDFKNRWKRSSAEEVARLKEELSVDGDVVICVARHDKKKGIDLLIEGFAEVESDTTLLLIGKGELRPAHEELAAHLGVENQVRFIERVPRNELRTYYALADVSCNLSVTDAFCNPVVEAMSQGTQVLVTPGVGAGWYLRDKKYCYLVENRTASEVAEKLKAALTNKPSATEQEQIVTDSRRFENSKVLEEWYEFIDEVVA